jgi:hypothetical protein
MTKGLTHTAKDIPILQNLVKQIDTAMLKYNKAIGEIVICNNRFANSLDNDAKGTFFTLYQGALNKEFAMRQLAIKSLTRILEFQENEKQFSALKKTMREMVTHAQSTANRLLNMATDKDTKAKNRNEAIDILHFTILRIWMFGESTADTQFATSRLKEMINAINMGKQNV